MLIRATRIKNVQLPHSMNTLPRLVSYEKSSLCFDLSSDSRSVRYATLLILSYSKLHCHCLYLADAIRPSSFTPSEVDVAQMLYSPLITLLNASLTPFKCTFLISRMHSRCVPFRSQAVYQHRKKVNLLGGLSKEENR